MTRQPARAPLPRAMQFHRVEPHLDAVRLGVIGDRAIGGKQRQLGVAARSLVKGFDLTTPSLLLAVVDLAEVQHLALHHLAAGTALVLDNIPIAMFFAVFEAPVEPQEHDANQLTQNQINEKILGLHYRRFSIAPIDSIQLIVVPPHEKCSLTPRVEKVGLAARKGRKWERPTTPQRFTTARAQGGHGGTGSLRSRPQEWRSTPAISFRLGVATCFSGRLPVRSWCG